MRFAFAGDRQISCNILKLLISKGYQPEFLFVSDNSLASHSKELISISGLPENKIFYGNEFKSTKNVEKLKSSDLDYIFGIHFPYIIPKLVLNIPKIGFLNLHPAYLPFNKGWNTPSWAILDNTPYGATLHFMTEALDEGDIIHQKRINILPSDTANSLYQRVLKLEEEVFEEALESLVSLNPNKTKQNTIGTSYSKKDLKEVQEINLSKDYSAVSFLNILRALTTNNKSEAAYYKIDDKKIGIHIDFFDME